LPAPAPGPAAPAAKPATVRRLQTFPANVPQVTVSSDGGALLRPTQVLFPAAAAPASSRQTLPAQSVAQAAITGVAAAGFPAASPRPFLSSRSPQLHVAAPSSVAVSPRTSLSSRSSQLQVPGAGGPPIRGILVNPRVQEPQPAPARAKGISFGMRWSMTIGSPTESVGKRVSAVEAEREMQRERQWEEERAMLGYEAEPAGDAQSRRGRGRGLSDFEEEEEDASWPEEPPPGRGRARSGTCTTGDLEAFLS